MEKDEPRAAPIVSFEKLYTTVHLEIKNCRRLLLFGFFQYSNCKLVKRIFAFSNYILRPPHDQTGGLLVPQTG